MNNASLYKIWPHNYCGQNLLEVKMKNWINIHTIYKDGRYVVFHPESFSLFLVSQEIGDILSFFETQSQEIDIIANKFNISEDRVNMILNYISDCISHNSAKDLEWTNSEPRSLNLMISQDCNLKCVYCYADYGTYGCGKKLMDFDTAKKSIDKLLNKSYDNRIVFFGGEPFLNFRLMNEIESYVTISGLNIKYTTVTNGTIMNDDIKNFIDRNFFNLGMSLDGPKEINDLQRCGNLESVHDCVVETITKLRQRNYPLTIRSVATKKSINYLSDIIDYRFLAISSG